MVVRGIEPEEYLRSIGVPGTVMFLSNRKKLLRDTHKRFVEGLERPGEVLHFHGLARAQARPQVPVCLWIKTIKGYGVKSTEESASGGHGFPLANGEKIVAFVDEIYAGQTPDEFRQWAQALSGRSRGASGTGTYWFPIES